MLPIILIHYQEIALKGNNRPFFENNLINNLQRVIGENQINKEFGRIIIVLKNKREFSQLKPKIAQIPGIANFSFAFQEQKDLQKIKKSLLELINKRHFSSFVIRSKRADKQFPLDSQAINRKLGQVVSQATKAKVDLENPRLKIYLEIGQKDAYLYFKKFNGLGGLPVAGANRLLCLISGGIDSPVAAYKMIKRGARVDFIHFHSYPQTNKASIEKVKDLIVILNRFQYKAKVFLIPFLNFQKEFFRDSNHRFLVILYRRAMFRLAQKLALKEGYLGLISGDSLGQVASQTLENLAVINQIIKIPTYRPLIGDDKKEIIDLAKKIGTYSISIRRQQDCCSLFVPRHPATKAKLKAILREEEKIGYTRLVNQSFKEMEIINIR